MQSRYLVDGQLVGRLLIYKVADKAILEYLLPLRINLLKGVTLVVDGSRQFGTQPLYCDSPGCIGLTPLSSELVSAFKSGSEVKLVFAVQGDSRVFAFPFTLKGFTSSYNNWQAGREN